MRRNSGGLCMALVRRIQDATRILVPVVVVCALMTIAGKTVAVRVQAQGCTYTVAPTSNSAPAGGAAQTVSVATSSGCGWTAASNVPWMTITAGASGNGAGLTYAADIQPIMQSNCVMCHSGTSPAAGRDYTTYAGVMAVVTPYDPNSLIIFKTQPGGSMHGVLQPDPVARAEIIRKWIVDYGAPEQNASETVSYTVAANSGAARTGTLTVAAQTVTVTQQGQACSYTVSPTSNTAPASGAAQSVSVTTSTSCSWTATSNATWISITSGASGSGNGTVNYTVAANTATAARTGALSVDGQTVTVAQAGACAYTVSPMTDAAPAAGAALSVSVMTSAGCSWTATSIATWISITAGASGSGNGTVNYTVAANTGTAARTGTLSVDGQTVTVAQAGQTCSYTLSPTTASAPAAGAALSTSVSTSTACSWTAASNATWISITAGASGSGNGTVNYTVATNTGTTRTGTLTVAGQTVSVTQQGQSPTFPVAPPLAPPSGTIVNVSSEAQLQTAVQQLTSNTTIVLAPGTYDLSSTLRINGTFTNVGIRGGTNNRDDVVLKGPGMNNAAYLDVPYGIWTGGSVQGITIANLTIRDVYYHPIILDGGTESPRIYNVHLVDAGQQFIKANPDGLGGGVDNGSVEYSVIENTTTAREYNTNGVDVFTGANWVIRRNLFRNIVAPAGQLAGPAVLMWSGSSNTLTEGNVFVNCARGVSDGLVDAVTRVDHTGGIIRNNFFYRSSGQPGDVAIHVADSPNTKVLNNTIFLSGTYSTPIE